MAEIAFTDSVKAQQKRFGSRRSYAQMEAMERGTELSFAKRISSLNETVFIWRPSEKRATRMFSLAGARKAF
jgi:hypothetical protein